MILVKQGWSGLADHLKVTKTFLFIHSFKAPYITGWKPVPAVTAVGAKSTADKKISVQLSFQGVRVKIDKTREGETQMQDTTYRSVPNKGDMTAKALVTHGHFAKGIHTESNWQEKAHIWGRVFQDKGAAQAAKRALTQGKAGQIWAASETEA